MYQRNIVRNSLCESVMSNRSIEKPHLDRAPSLDSLGNSSGHSGSSSSRDSAKNKRRGSVKIDYMEEYHQEINNHHSVDEVDDVDSIEDPQEIGGRVIQTTQVQIHASKADLDFDDDEAVVQSEIPKDPVVTAYLEKASHICQNSCVKSMVQFNSRKGSEDNIVSADDPKEEDIVPDGNGSANGFLLPAPTTSTKNRRTSLSSGSVGRMETIVEEPIEAKVSVKEILARFETLRESAEVNCRGESLSLARASVWASVLMLIWSGNP